MSVLVNFCIGAALFFLLVRFSAKKVEAQGFLPIFFMVGVIYGLGSIFTSVLKLLGGLGCVRF